MNCVIITLTYPYGKGDRFLSEEIPVIAQEFEHIYILPLFKRDGVLRPLPKNVSLIRVSFSKPIVIMKVLARSDRIIRDVKFGRKKGYRNLVKMFHRAFMYEYSYYSSIKTLESIDNDCLFYSYWLSEPAYLLARYKMKHNSAVCFSRAHGYDCFKERGYNPFRREIVENIDCIYSISEKGKEDLEKNLIPISRNNHRPNLKVSHLGVFTGDKMNPINRDIHLFRIVSCSNVVQVKRLDILAEAISLVQCGEKTIEWVQKKKKWLRIVLQMRINESCLWDI